MNDNRELPFQIQLQAISHQRQKLIEEKEGLGLDRLGEVFAPVWQGVLKKSGVVSLVAVGCGAIQREDSGGKSNEPPSVGMDKTDQELEI